MKICKALFLSSCLLIQGGNAYSVLKNTASAKAVATDESASDTTSRRNLLRSAAALSAGALLGSVNPGIALADDDVATPVYFGVGVSSKQKDFGDIFSFFDTIVCRDGWNCSKLSAKVSSL